jgi:hypothetical protein
VPSDASMSLVDIVTFDVYNYVVYNVPNMV